MDERGVVGGGGHWKSRQNEELGGRARWRLASTLNGVSDIHLSLIIPPFRVSFLQHPTDHLLR